MDGLKTSRIISRISLGAIALCLLFALAGDIFLFAKGYRSAWLYLLILIAAAAGAVFAALKWLPRIDASEEAAQTKSPSEDKEERADAEDSGGSIVSPVVLVRRADAAGGYSSSWVSTLEAAAGAISRIEVKNIKEIAELAAGAQLIVIPASEASVLIGKESDVLALEELAAAGIAVIVEAAGGHVAELLGIKCEDKPARGTPTYASADVLGETIAEIITGSPVSIEIAAVKEMPPVYTNWLSAGNTPAVVSRPAGRGALIVALFNYGKLSYAMKHIGVEAASKGREAFQGASAPGRKCDYPYADILDEFIVGIAGKYAFIPRWSKHPGNAKASIAAMCEDDCAGRRADVLIKMMDEFEIVPTFFFLADESDAALKNIEPGKCEAALMWNRQRASNIGGVLKGNKIPSLKQQHEQLRTVCSARGANMVAVARIHMKRWDETAAGSMESAGVAADCTFGPARGSRGFVYGGAFPFRLLERTGSSGKLFEMPCQLDDDGPAPIPEWVEGFVKKTHECGGLAAFSLSDLRQIQSPAWRDAVKVLLKKAQSLEINLCGAGEFVEWWIARLAGRMSVRVEGGSVFLEAETAADSIALEIPARFRGTALSSAAVDGAPCEDALISNRIMLSPGAHEIELQYLS